MRIEQLRIDGLRCLKHVELVLQPGLNLFLGCNGAGKTSVLEAAYMLSHARSFRAGTRDVLIRHGDDSLQVFAQLHSDQGATHRLGLARTAERWQARIDGVASGRLSDLLEHCAVVCFEPGSHALIAGSGETRRRFIDWGVFHVEHDFLTVWRRYQRALKQRNSLLRSDQRVPDAQFIPWEQEMAVAATAIDGWRSSYLEALQDQLARLFGVLLPELGGLRLDYMRGWDNQSRLQDDLARLRARDRARGHTTAGIHRADWMLGVERAPQREHLSRGQEKLCALACVLAQATLFATNRGEWPVVCLDDLSSELDMSHQRAVVSQLVEQGAQVLITGTERTAAFADHPATTFHVEQGAVTPEPPS